MSTTNIIRILGLLVAIIAALITIPYAAVVLALLGLIVGFFVKKDERLFFLILAVAMATVAGSLGVFPTIGIYLTGILTNVSALLTAGAVTVILLYLYESMTE